MQHLTTQERNRLRSAYLAYRRRGVEVDEAIDAAITAVMTGSRSSAELRDKARNFLTPIERANTTARVE